MKHTADEMADIADKARADFLLRIADYFLDDTGSNLGRK